MEVRSKNFELKLCEETLKFSKKESQVLRNKLTLWVKEELEMRSRAGRRK